jgi:small GTP-binding protein
MIDPVTITALYILSRAFTKRTNTRTTFSSPPPDPIDNPSHNPPEKIITFIGAVSTGKSSTINAILGNNPRKVGIEHGTTKLIEYAEYRQGYNLCDTPGLMDKFTLNLETKQTIRKSETIIYVCTGQLYNDEINLLRKINDFQHESNKTKLHRKRKLALYVNKRDLSQHMMSPTMISTEEKCIRNQVSFIEAHHIVYGSSSPFDGVKYTNPNIYQLQCLVDLLITQ